jgi:IMP dehydrogenase
MTGAQQEKVMMEIREALTFDDVLLVPQYSEVKSRSQVDISTEINGLKFRHPIVPANMQSVTGFNMAASAIYHGGLAILHRFMLQQEQFDIAEDFIEEYGKQSQFGVSLGVKEQDLINFEEFYDIGVRIFCIDIAHGDSEHCVRMIKTLKERHPNITLIAGNVATGPGAERLWRAGADVVKVGVGPGSLCTTRIETGNGVPQLTALMDVAHVRHQLSTHQQLGMFGKSLNIIADGGIKSAGDVVKALCFADMVMIGNMFAGCIESPGETHYINNIPHKEYRGSSTHKTNHIEGVVAYVPCTGNYETVLTKLLEGLRSGCSYQGANSLAELRENPTFIRITSAGLKESHPHDVITK